MRPETSTRASSAASAVSVATSINTTIVTATRVKDLESLFHTMWFNPRVCHLPIPISNAEGGICCVMCCWATGKKYKAQMSYCEGCNVALCVLCFNMFHTVDNIEAQKGVICLGTVSRKL
jgi:hypothetical protein